MTDLATLSPREIRDLALTLAKKDQQDRHWSRLAQIIGYVEAGRLFSLPDFGGHPSLRSWALNDLNLGSGDVGVLRRLFTMMHSHAATIRMDEWREIGRGKAEVLLKIHKMGADDTQMRGWVDRAKDLTATALEDAYKEAAGIEDEWVTVEMSLPRETAALWSRALECRLADAMEQPHPDPKMIHDKAVEHKLVELIATEVIQQYGQPE